MRVNAAEISEQDVSNGRLLRTLADELKLPLLQIARAAELARMTGDVLHMEQTEVLADTVLKLLDSYVLSTQTLVGQQTLQLEPVSLRAMLYDTTQYLQRLAKLYNCDIDLRVSGKFGLVMAHPGALQAALLGLGYSFINAVSGERGTSRKRTRIVLTADRSKQGITTGIEIAKKDMSADAMQQAKALYGFARQPMREMTHASGAGVMVASSLFDAMASELRVKRSHNSSGLVATLLPSQQLALL